MELRKDYAERYCECCGRKNTKIWKFLMKQPLNDKKFRIWHNHKNYVNDDYFYDEGSSNFCCDCGTKLDDEDIKTSTESRGEFWGAPCSETIIVGYKCPSCGHNETF